MGNILAKLDANDLDWLGAPPEGTEAPPADTLEAELEAALEDWRARSYVQNVPWTATNENRRAKAVELISSLLTNYTRRGSWSPRMRELGERLVENSKKR